MGKNKGLKILGITVSLTWVMIIALYLFIKSLSLYYEEFFTSNALTIMIISGIVVFLGIITGAITLRALTKGGKGIF